MARTRLNRIKKAHSLEARPAVGATGNPLEQARRTTTNGIALGGAGRRNRSDALVFDDALLHELKGPRALRTLERMALDPICAGILEYLSLLIRTPEWTVEPGGDDALDQEFAEFVTENVHRIVPGWQSVLADAADCLKWGFQLFEAIFEPVNPFGTPDAGVMWHAFMPYDATTINRWHTDPQTADILGVRQILPRIGGEVDVPYAKLLHFRTRATAGRPEGRSLLRNAFLAWVDKQELRRVTKVGIRRDLTGLPILEAPGELFEPNLSPEDAAVKAEAERLVRDIERDVREGILLPHAMLSDGKSTSGWRLSLLSSGGRRAFAFADHWQQHNRDMAIAMLADVVLLGHEKVGSFALADSKTNTLARSVGAILDVFGEHMETHATRVLQLLNPRFLSAKIPTWRHGDIEELPIETLGAFVAATAGAGALTPDESLEAALRRRARLPERLGSEEL